METGTIIHGTLRNSDLIEAFVGKLDEIPTGGFHDGTLAHAHELLSEGGDLNYGERADEATECVHALMDALNDCAPEGCYFGSIEGDGSDFGFWRLEDV